MKASLLLAPFLAAAVMLLPACQRSTGGPLDPVPSAGIEAGKDRSAVVHDGELTARITARWSSTGENSMRINYRNSGRILRAIPIHALKMTHPSGEAALRAAVDATGVDLSDARTDNDRPKVLFVLENGADASATLNLPPGASREIDAEFTSFSNDRKVQAGDRIIAAIPTGTRTAAVTFVAREP